MKTNQLLENAYIYKIIISDEVVYIGKTYQPILNRIDEHVQRCHNKELKDAMLHNYYTFEIIYESHNTITSDILNSIEESFIAQFKPKYNKCGVTLPYNSYSSKPIFSGGGIATQLSKKHYYSDQDIDQVLVQNAQVSAAYICCKDEYSTLFFGSKFADLSQKYQEECLEYSFGKVNKFNQMTSYGKIGFRQSSYCVKDKTGNIRFPSVEEKLKGIKKEELLHCHIVFLFKTKEEYRDAYSKLLQIDSSDKSNWSEEDKLNCWIYTNMESTRLHQAEENYNKKIFKYYPLEIISFGNDIDKSYGYLDTWDREYCDNLLKEKENII